MSSIDDNVDFLDSVISEKAYDEMLSRFSMIGSRSIKYFSLFHVSANEAPK